MVIRTCSPRKQRVGFVQISNESQVQPIRPSAFSHRVGHFFVHATPGLCWAEKSVRVCTRKPRDSSLLESNLWCAFVEIWSSAMHSQLLRLAKKSSSATLADGLSKEGLDTEYYGQHADNSINTRFWYFAKLLEKLRLRNTLSESSVNTERFLNAPVWGNSCRLVKCTVLRLKTGCLTISDLSRL